VNFKTGIPAHPNCVIGTSGDRLRELQILEQIAEARYEAYRDNMLPGLEEKERELLSLRQEIADLEAAKQASEEALLRTEHEVESPEEYDRYMCGDGLGSLANRLFV
jgi:hypothetical protein